MPEKNDLFDLLAPVPLIHLPLTNKTDQPGVIAFGSDMDQLFSALAPDLITGMKVWIYASKTGSENLDPKRLQRVCFVGDYGGSTATGLSQDYLEGLRPMSAKNSDSAWTILWLVKNLQPIPPRYYSDFLSAKTKKPLGTEPRGPMLVLPNPIWAGD